MTDDQKNKKNNFKQHLRKHKKHYTIYATVAIIVFILAGFLLSLYTKVGLYLDDEVQIEQESIIELITTTDVSPEINEEVAITLRSGCEATCNIFTESDNKHYSIGGSQQVQFTTRLPPSKQGSSLFSLTTRCTNQKTTFCPSDEKPRESSSLVFVDVEWSSDEKRILEDIASIEEKINKFINVQTRHANYIEATQSWPTQFNDVNEANTALAAVANDISEKNSIFIEGLSEWQEGELESAIQKINTLHVEQIERQLNNADIDYLQEKLVTLRSSLQKLENTSSKWKGIAEHYSAEGLTSNRVVREYERLELFSNYLTQLQGVDVQVVIDQINRTNKGYINHQSTFNELQANTTQLVNRIKRQLNETEVTVASCQDARDSQAAAVAHNSNSSHVPVDNTAMQPLFSSFCSAVQTSAANITEITIDTSLFSFNTVNQKQVELISIDEPEQFCCANEECKVCEEKAPYAVVFIHGHSFSEQRSPEAMFRAYQFLQHELEEENIINAHALEYDVFSDGALGVFGQPVSYAASYYFVNFIDVGGFSVTVQENDGIENYALRLREIITEVKKQTKTDNVVIIAHSMGGLVTREYLRIFGSDTIKKVITVNSPHQGITGLVDTFCPVFGSSRECEDMRQGSLSMNRLQAAPVFENTTVIYTVGCDMNGITGDGVVDENAAQLPGAHHIQLNGTCSGSFDTSLHSGPLQTEELADIIKRELTS